VDLWALAERFGMPMAMLFFGIYALYTDRVVSGRRYREVCRQRDNLLKLALGGQRKAWQATDLAEAVVLGQGEGEGSNGDAVN
jgi:hypothetical protein